jgi:hypothetical protein
MHRTAIGWAIPLVAALGLALMGCAKPPAPVEQPASNEPGPPPATPVVPVQSQPLNEPTQ